METFVNNIEYKIAFKEVYEILKHVSDEALKKIPEEVMAVIKGNMQADYEYKIDVGDFKNQEMSEITKAILSMIYAEYWANEEEKNAIKIKDDSERTRIEKEKRIKYNPDNIFKKAEIELKDINTSENVQLIKYKESIFRRIINFFKK